jgi:CYTH domain-containing protein
MPTEHEFKYILDLSVLDADLIFPVKPKKYLIQQGYLAFSKGHTTRIRCIEHRKPDPKTKWMMTVKHKVTSGRVVEIEKKLDVRDGLDLWECAMGKLKKIRHSFDNNNIKWEIDFFFKGESFYFALAEAELEEGQSRPEIIDCLKPYLLYEVDLDDDRFSNKRLGDVDYATKIYNEITEEHNNENERENLQPN